MTVGSKLTVDFGKNMVDRLTSDSPTRSIFEKWKVGVGTTEADTTDSDLETAIPITGTESVDSCDAANWSDSAGVTSSLNNTTYKEGSGALNITKDGAGTTDINVYKTTTSRDFTSKELSLWIYIVDATTLAYLATTDCLTIRFGSNSSNYYQWTKDASDFSTGWNLIQGLDTDNEDSTTGTPTITACDYTYIGLTTVLGSNTWSAGDVILDDVKLASSDDYIISEVSGYPTTDLPNYEITHRGFLSSTMANGYPLTEAGVFNTDSTPLLGVRGTFNSVSKTTTDELVIISVIKTRLNSITS